MHVRVLEGVVGDRLAIDPAVEMTFVKQGEAQPLRPVSLLQRVRGREDRWGGGLGLSRLRL